MPRAAAPVIARGAYFTDGTRLLQVRRVAGEVVICEDANDPTVRLEVSLDDMKTMRLVEAEPDGV
jgi:hypothetical protein